MEWAASFWAGAASVALLAFLVLLKRMMRRSGEHAALEEREAFQRKQAEAIAAAAQSDRKATERMADAQAASVGQPADRIRQRMYKRPANTR